MLMFDLSTPSFKMRCEISHIVVPRGGFFNESSRKPLKFTKTPAGMVNTRILQRNFHIFMIINSQFKVHK